MPDEATWDRFFDPLGILDALAFDTGDADVVDFGCGYGTFTIAAAARTSGTVYAIDIDPAMITATKSRAHKLALGNVTTVLRDFVADGTGLPGGIAGYAIGYYLFEYIGEPILKLYGYGQKYAEAAALFDAWGPWILIAKGWTPFPYKVLTIAAGVFKMSVVPFVLASIVARAMRFYLVAALLYWFGEPIRDFVEKRLSLVTAAFVVLLVGGFVAVRYVF